MAMRSMIVVTDGLSVVACEARNVYKHTYIPRLNSKGGPAIVCSGCSAADLQESLQKMVDEAKADTATAPATTLPIETGTIPPNL